MRKSDRIDPRRLEGRRIVVTGGGSGIGRAGAIRFSREGASVAILDRRYDNAAVVAKEIREQGGNAIAFRCDVADETEVAEAVQGAAGEFRGLDGLFANAGTAGFGWIHETTLANWNRVIEVNLTGAFLSAKHCLPYLIDNGGGSIVTTASVAATIISAGGSAASYAASKGGVVQLTKQIAVDYAEFNIRAVSLCPGETMTDMRDHVTEDTADAEPPQAQLPRQLFAAPMKRLSEPDEQAAAAAFLLSDEASFITGIAVCVDGGLTAI